MSRTATMASAKPTWASWGVATTSPTAYTPSSAVRWWLSTVMKPRSSTSTLVPSRPSPSVSGRRPTDTTTLSTVTDSPSPSFTVTWPFDCSWPSTVTPVRTVMPRFLNERTTTSTTSASQPGQQLGQGLEEGDLAAEVAQHGGELAADGAAADDRGRRRQLVELQHVVGGQDRLAVGLEAGDGAGHRAGGQDDVRAVQLGAVVDA